jgi:predicted amidohydrolase
MSTLDVALVQTCTPADQAAALEHARPLIEEAAKGGTQLILLPECANMMEQRKDLKAQKLEMENEDVFVSGVRAMARELGVHILIGSVIVRAEDSEKSANRSLLVSPEGGILARYDKVHLFDADTTASPIAKAPPCGRANKRWWRKRPQVFWGEILV